MSASQQVEAWVTAAILVPIALGVFIGLSEAATRGMAPVSAIAVALSALGCLMFAYDAARWAEITRGRSCGMCGVAILIPVLLTVILLVMGLVCALIACVVGLCLTVRWRQPLWAILLVIGGLAPFLIIAARIYGILPSFSLEERPLYATYTLFLLPSLVVAAYAYSVRRKLPALFTDTR